MSNKDLDKLEQFPFISIPPHTMLPSGIVTQQWHCFFATEHRRFYTLDEAKRVLAERLHVIRGKQHFVQFACIPNCEVWKLAEATMQTATDKAIAAEFSSDGEQIYFREREEARLDVRDAIQTISHKLQPKGPLQGRQN